MLQVAQGMIWVWGDNGRDAGLESALTPAALVPELNDAEGLKSGRVVALSPYVRDLPYAWETLMENLMVSNFLARGPQLGRHRFRSLPMPPPSSPPVLWCACLLRRGFLLP